MSDHDEHEEWDEEPPTLDEHESALIREDLRDLERFEAAFAPEGYRGVAVFCPDCVEEHFYPWEMLRENLRVLLETGETPVHEPAFAPDPSQYVPWEYARGYADALREAGVLDRAKVGACPRCGLHLGEQLANFCPRCGTPLLRERLREALASAGLEPDAVEQVLRRAGLPG